MVCGFNGLLAEKLLRQDITRAVRRAATARMLAEILQVVAVVEGQFLADRDVAAGDDPDAALDQFRVAVGRATVVEKARRIGFHLTVEIKFLVEMEEAVVAGAAAAEGFTLGNPLAPILDDPRARRRTPRCRGWQAPVPRVDPG